MKKRTLLIYTETPLHVGCGKDVGAIDMPVARERITGQPIIPGSGLKGALRHMVEFELSRVDDAKHLFGCEGSIGARGETIKTSPGSILFSEARIVLFPVRAPKGGFAMTTSPLALARLSRGLNQGGLEIDNPNQNECCASQILVTNGKVVLEEYAFTQKCEVRKELKAFLCDKISDPVYTLGLDRLAVLNDADFSYFCENCTEVTAHNRIDPKTGVVEDGALFNVECVPSEALFQATLSARNDSALDILDEILEKHPVLQFGGKATTGRGICNLNLI